MFNCCGKRRDGYKLNILEDDNDFSNETVASNDVPEPYNYNNTHMKGVKQIVIAILVLVVLQLLIFGFITGFSAYIYSTKMPTVNKIILQIDSDLPLISEIAKQSPTIVRIIKEANSSMPEILNVINMLNEDIPRINSTINMLSRLSNSTNVAQIQKVIDKLPEIIKIIDFVYKNIPHIAEAIIHHNSDH